MLHAFAKHGDISQALGVYLQLKSDPQHAPDVGTHNRIIDACADDGNAQLASTWFGMMQDADSGVPSDVATAASSRRAPKAATCQGRSSGWRHCSPAACSQLW